jgi:hypothetical protein
MKDVEFTERLGILADHLDAAISSLRQVQRMMSVAKEA